MSNFRFPRSYRSLGVIAGFGAVSAVLVLVSCADHATAKAVFVHKEAPKPGVLAKIGDEEITEAALVGDDKLDFFDLEKKKYELRMDRLNKLMVEKLIGSDAKKANMSLDDYINKKIAGGDIKISDKDYKKFVAEKHIPESQINPQIKERIMAYLQTMRKQDLVTAYLAKLTKNQPVEVYFNKPKMQLKVEIGDAPSFGSADAKVKVIEFSDIQCPYCSRGNDTVNQVKKKYGNKIQLAFKHYPLPMHQQARPAAEASLCVNAQGADKFWKFLDISFKGQDKLDKASLEKYAQQAGANVKQFAECVEKKTFIAAVDANIKQAEGLGVKSTPTFFVVGPSGYGELVSGAVPLETMSEIIDESLNTAK